MLGRTFQEIEIPFQGLARNTQRMTNHLPLIAAAAFTAQLGHVRLHLSITLLSFECGEAILSVRGSAKFPVIANQRARRSPYVSTMQILCLLIDLLPQSVPDRTNIKPQLVATPRSRSYLVGGSML